MTTIHSASRLIIYPMVAVPVFMRGQFQQIFRQLGIPSSTSPINYRLTQCRPCDVRALGSAGSTVSTAEMPSP
ncbi:hypothetical protein P4S72_16110 [Vibrio sp. PP-XX7]